MINKILLKSNSRNSKVEMKRVNSRLAPTGQRKHFRASWRIWRNYQNSGEFLSWTSGSKWDIRYLISSTSIYFPDAPQIFDVVLYDILKTELSLYKNQWSSVKWNKIYSMWQVIVCQNYSFCKEERSFWLATFKFWCTLCFFMYLTIFSVEDFFFVRNFNCCHSEK